MILILFGFVAVFLPSIFCFQNPNIYDNSSSGMIVDEGESIKLACYTNGNLTIKWHKNASYGYRINPFLPNGELSCDCGNFLELPSITKDHRGRYVCSVENYYGSAAKYIDLEVEFQPIIVQTRRIDNVDREEIELHCEASSYPPPAVTWNKDGREIYSNLQHRIIHHEPIFDDGLNTTVIISTKFDYNGTYECIIANRLGITASTFHVEALVSKEKSAA